MTLSGDKKELQAELSRLIEEESSIDSDLREYFSSLSGNNRQKATASPGASLAFDSTDLSKNIAKVKDFAPCFEAMVQDSKKLALQVEDCRTLSDRLSILVRRLDLMQMRAQQALACAEDVINLKDCKAKILAGIEAGNLPLAVSFIRQVHEIDVQAAKASDDYGAIQQAEREVRTMVQKEFLSAIDASDVNAVMALCPLLQTLGLEVEARDNFLSFVERTVFIGVSADASAVDGATDPATGYAQALSNVFNSTYIILQQYLPMVIQGMDASLGDVHFIRRLHSKCEIESGLVLKRYMKYRNIKDMVASLKTSIVSASSKSVSSADMHTVLDELGLLIQYCCSYSKYLKNICNGAETRKRAPQATNTTNASVPSISVVNSTVTTVAIFAGPTEFDKMVDELINKYYMEGEHWLMRLAVKTALPKSMDENLGLDECFFVLHRCAQRSIATSNIQAACAILHLISDLLSSDMANQAADLLQVSAVKVGASLTEHMARYTRQGTADNQGTGGDLISDVSDGVSLGFKSAMSLASSITGGSETERTSNTMPDEDRGDDDDEADTFGVGKHMEAFNAVEMCIRYTERLLKDSTTAGGAVFGNDDSGAVKASTGTSNVLSSPATKQSSASSPSLDTDKLRLCKESFETAKSAFNQALKQGMDKLVVSAQGIFKDVLTQTLGRHGPFGGVRFDLADDKFEMQPALPLLPRALVSPLETLLEVCTFNLSERNKDIMVGKLADACSERVEHFVSQTSFRFAGALKLEECIRAIVSVFTRASSSPIRGKFSRLREIMSVLTSDMSAGMFGDNFTCLTANEVVAFQSLRMDSV